MLGLAKNFAKLVVMYCLLYFLWLITDNKCDETQTYDNGTNFTKSNNTPSANHTSGPLLRNISIKFNGYDNDCLLTLKFLKDAMESMPLIASNDLSVIPVLPDNFNDSSANIIHYFDNYDLLLMHLIESIPIF